MRVIAKSKLVAFWSDHADARASLTHWYEVATAADWGNPADVVGAVSRAKALNGERVRFDVAGGEYRLVVAFDFARRIAFVKFVGAHAEYDKVNALTVNLF